MEGDTAPLRSAASQWSLAGDKQLLGVLQNIHERLVSRCQETNKKLGEMATALDDATVDLHNVNNKFMALSNTQFIESRVYDDDVEVAPPVETTKEPKIPPDATSEIEKLKLGLKVLESMHEPLHILHDTDSESDEDDEVSRMVLKPKDPYAHRPLPYIIGSYAWQNKWHAGLLPEDSDTDSSVMKQDSREEYSDSEPESTGNIQTDKLHVPERTMSTASSDMISEELPSPSPAKPAPADVAAELARRLGGQTTKTSEPEMEYTPPVPTTKKIYKPEKPATSTIFSDEPPPLEHSYSDRDDYSQEEDDDIFAELNKNKPYAQNNRVQSQVTEDLFGGLGRNEIKNDRDMFADFREPPEPAKQKSTLFSDESEPELFAEKSQPKPIKHDTTQEINSVKKPVGGISLFGNKGTESIGAAILKRNQRQSSAEDDTASEEIDSHREEIRKEKDIFDDLFAKSEKEQKKLEQKVEKVEKNVVKEVQKEKKIDLFSDNIFDDIDDIFTSNIPKVPIKEASKNQKSIFDDEDDLFSNVAITKDTKPEIKTSSNIKKSIFDSDDELFSEKNVSKPIESQKTYVKSETESKISKTAKNIFDDSSDSDIFSEEAVSKKNPVNIIGNSKKDLVRNNENVEKVTENITNETLVESITKPEDQMIEKSIFDEDDIFNTIPSKNSQHSKPLDAITDEVHAKDIVENIKQNKNDESKNISAKPIFDVKLQNDIFANSSKQDVNKLTTTNVPKSLFDNDSEEELFSNKSKHKNNHEVIQNKPKSKVVNEAGDNVFKNTDLTYQNSIETTEHSQNINTENILFNKGNDTRKNKQEPNKNDVMNIVNEEEIDDLFTKDKTLDSVTDTGKEETDSIVNKANDDEWKDDLFKNSKTQEILETHDNSTITKIKSTYDKKIGEHLFINSNENTEQTNVSTININDSFDKTPEILEKDSLIAEKNESEISKADNTIDSNVNAQNTQFLDETNVNIEKPPLFTEQNDSGFNKSDIFSDIFSEPPEFEKPKEPKKSKNVNALFDDDSDDEALFFKKNDPTLDDKPEYSLPTAENRLFGLFHDEPPALDVDFVQKTTKISNFDDAPKDQVDFNNDFAKSETIVKEKEPKTPESPISENEFVLPAGNKITDQPNDPKKDSNRIGKLKTMNFNINVNALLPGASPKKVKATEKGKEPDHTKSEVDIRIKDSTIQEIEPKIIKSISFEGKTESQVLDNTLSKERAKIQVKRRPSTRRARKEAVRKSAIDFGDDSVDHSSSIDDTSRADNSENDLKTAVDSENVTDSLSYDSIVDVEDFKPDIVPPDSIAIEKSKSVTEPKVAEVKTKTVYILNDEDIFDIAPKSDTKQTLNTKVSNIVDADLFQNRLEPSTTENKKENKLDVNEKLPKATEGELQDKNIGSHFNADVETLFTTSKSKHLNIIEDDDDLFKTKTNAGVNTLGKVYKETKSTNAEDESLFTAQNKNTRDNIDTGKGKNTENLKETSPFVDESIKSQTKEIKDKIETTLKTNENKEKPKKVSIFDLSDEENELFNKNTKSISKSVFDSDSDEELFNKKGAVKKEKVIKEKIVKERDVKVDVKASLFGDDDDDDLFGVKTKKSIATASQSTQPTTKEAGIKTTEPVFDDPLSLFGGEDD